MLSGNRPAQPAPPYRGRAYFNLTFTNAIGQAMDWATCDVCSVKPAVFRSTDNDESISVCDTCLPLVSRDGNDGGWAVLSRFISILTDSHQACGHPISATMPMTTTCPVCGLTFANLCRDGLLGCAVCYEVFAPALSGAIRTWQGGG